MKIFDRIVQSNTEPSIHSLWVRGNDILIFGKNGWKALDFSGNKELKELLEQEIKDREDSDQEIKDTYLPLSGGEMTGNITHKATSIGSNYIQVLRSMGDYTMGSRLNMLGVDGYGLDNEENQVGVYLANQPINNWNNWGAADLGLNIHTVAGNTKYKAEGVSLPGKTASDILTAAASIVKISTINGTPIMTTESQSFNLAPLENGLVPSVYLPSYVDDVLEYSSVDSFPETGESGKIYVDTTTNLTYRWSGSQYIEVSKSIGLGTSSADAYPGNLGQQNANNIAALQEDITGISGINETIENIKANYLRLSGGTMMGQIDTISGISFGDYYTTFLSFNDGKCYLNKDGLTLVGYEMGGVAIGEPVISCQTGNSYPTITMGHNGVTISNKTENDLLNASGSTTSISDIVSQVDLSGYLPLTGGTLTGQLTGTSIVANSSIYTPGLIYVGNISLIGSRHLHISGITDPNNIYLTLQDAHNNILSIGYNGINIPSKDASYLLNAGGSTTPISDIATQVQAAIVDSAPETLDTLNELAAALGDDPNFATTVTNQIAQKADKTVATTSSDGLMSSADKTKLDSVNISNLATKTELEGYLPLSGGKIYGDGLIISSKLHSKEFPSLFMNIEDSSTWAGTIGGVNYLPNPDTQGLIVSVATNIAGSPDGKVYTCLRAGGIIFSSGMGRSSCYGENFVVIGNSLSQLDTNRCDGSINLTDTINFYSNDRDGYDPSKLSSISSNGFTIKGKTANDLLHAAGGTISIDDLKTQIISDLSAQVSTLQTQIAELTSRIEALENA